MSPQVTIYSFVYVEIEWEWERECVCVGKKEKFYTFHIHYLINIAVTGSKVRYLSSDIIDVSEMSLPYTHP